jgi:hypothetical protein
MYIIARGHLDRLRRWEQDLTSKYFPYPYEPLRDGKARIGNMQLSVRPIQLYEVVFPKEYLNDVCQLIQPYGGYGISPKIINLLRKGLNVSGADFKPIPVVPPDMGTVAKDENGNDVFIPPKNFLIREGIDVLGLGIKEDKDYPFVPIENL